MTIMSDIRMLTTSQVGILKAAGPKRVKARIAILLAAGRISASAFAARGLDLVHAAQGLICMHYIPELDLYVPRKRRRTRKSAPSVA